MTLVRGLRQARGQSISQGGWGGWIGDPAAIPPPSAFNMGAAGVVVNERTVLSLMVVSSCVRILGDSSAGLEPRVYRQIGNRRSPQDPEVDPPEVITDPYADMDRFDGDFRKIASLGLNGNIMVHVVDRKGGKKGNPIQTEVLNPSMLKVDMKKGKKIYQIGAAGAEIPAADMIHVPWMSLAGGLVGLNPIELGANGFGIPIAAEQYAGRYFGQGMHPGGFLSIEKPLRPEDKKRVEQQLQTNHGGIAQAHTPLVLDNAAKWTQITVNPETAQLLQSRSFSRAEIAGFYGVPGFLLGDSPNQGGPWGKGLQETVMAFAIFSLNGWTRRLDRSDDLLLPPGYYTKRHVKDLFKTNDTALGAFVTALRQAAVATPNEAREIAGLAPSDEPGANSLFAPVNNSHADFLAPGDYGAESGLGETPPPVEGEPTGE
jgi:HK97 family phage portal protein